MISLLYNNSTSIKNDPKRYLARALDRLSNDFIHCVGATVEVESHRLEKLRGSEYFVIQVSPKHWKQSSARMLKPGI